MKMKDMPITRRTVLSVTQRIFDPIGFSCPVTLIPKLILQKSWQEKLSWDTELTEDLKKEFLVWLEDLSLLSSVRIPRQATAVNRISSSLHVFADASKYSYATAIFLRNESQDEIKVQLLQAKSRVSPLRKITIPRLELLACYIGAKLSEFVTKSLTLEINETYYWTDSTTALFWIKNNDLPWGTFVCNRVKKIRECSDPKDWRHVPGISNPADLPSRGCTVSKLLETKWWEGPLWLSKSKEEWPNSTPIENEEEIYLEQRKTVVATLTCENTENSWMLAYFSSYLKILRMTAWILRFLKNAQKTRAEQEIGELKLYELNEAEKILMKQIQQKSFNDEDISRLKSLCVFKNEEGILRVSTKLTERKDLESFISPILLPSTHKLVIIMIFYMHKSMCHAGIQILMSKLRERFWIIRSRKTIRKVLARCVRCKRRQTTRIECNPGVLPENRVKDALVFEITGIDLAGPLMLREKCKAWIIIFTCAVYRAIHLELITSQSTQSFLLGLRRFIARRGRPKVIYSDNGTNFTGANNLFKSLDWKMIEIEASVNRIQWNFNPPASPWWGGFWERMVQMVKKLLRRVLGQSALNYEEMTSVLCDCETTINSRPLTYVSEQGDELIPLTPAMFLKEIDDVGVPDLDQLDQVNLNKRLRYQQNLRNALRERFRSEYLGQLLQRPSKSKPIEPLKVGDIVLIETDGKKRTLWPMAKIIDVFPGKDGQVRVVRLKTSSCELVRPAQKIFPLEISSPTEPNLINNEARKNKPEKDLQVVGKTVRTRSGRLIKVPIKFLS
nr:uncharacterized protein LOC107437295 [Parasteatoda tepidariorum]